MSFSELENDTLNQSELNEIKIKENNHIDSRFLIRSSDDSYNRRKRLPICFASKLCRGFRK
jgi:hypothetical protein